MDLFTLSAKLQLDKKDYESGLNDAESDAYSKGQKIGTGLKGVGDMFGKAIVGMTKLTVAGIGAASTAVGALVKKSVQEYAEYQQTLGGVQKLYGTAGMSIEQYADSVGKSVDEIRGKYAELTQAQDMVLQNAQNAYKSAGMSTQQYMEQATSFSASLINSLGGDTVKAAEQTDVAMRAISDNYNTFGGDMQNIQNAFQGFAKGNFMMLDNLRLGYSGSKTEMNRLIADANTYAASIGQAADLSIDSFSDIVTAIELVQEKQGIAGTTAREASTTISGSLGMVKAAWDNLVTGMSDPDADLSQLINNVVNSIVGYTDEAGQKVNGFLDNIIPTIKQATQGLVQILGEAVPLIAEQLPSLINDVLPMLIETGVELFNGLVDALPTMMQILFNQLPMVIEAVINAVLTFLPMIIELGFQFLESLIKGITDAIPTLLPRLVEVIQQIADFFSDPNKLQELIKSAIVMIQQLALGMIDALPKIIPAIVQIVTGIAIALTEPTNLMRLIDAAVQIIIALADGLLIAIPQLLEAVPTIIFNLIEAIILLLPQILKTGAELIIHFAMGIIEFQFRVVQAVRNVVNGVKDNFMDRVREAKDWGKDLIDNFIGGILAKFESLKNTVKNVAQSVKDYLGFSEPKLGPLSNFHTYAPDMMDLFMEGINDNKGKLLDTVQGAFDFQDLISSPLVNVGAESNNIGYNGRGDIYNMLRQITEMLPMLADRQIVLDTGVLVGQTVDKYDDALGKLLSNKQRSV